MKKGIYIINNMFNECKMSRINIILVVLLLGCGVSSAQSVDILFNKLGVAAFHSKDYGNANLLFLYKTEVVKNKKKPDKKTFGIAELRVGEKMSLFADRNHFFRDSLSNASAKRGKVTYEDFQVGRAHKITFDPIVFKDFAHKNIIIQEKAGRRYQYEVPYPALDWELLGNTKVILGYKVEEAKVEYGGRKWTAWYAPEIPISDGPYIFNALPGLIMELYDSQDDYHFTLAGIIREQRPIYLRDEQKIMRVDRKQFRSAQAGYYENPALYLGKARNADGSELKLRSIPYNPIELK